MGSTGTNNFGEKQGKGFALTALILGLLTGIAVYGITEFWLDEIENTRLPLAVLFFITTAAAATLLLASASQMIRAAIFGIIIAAILTIPNYFMTVTVDDQQNLHFFPPNFWFLLGMPLSAYLMTTLAKASLDEGIPPPYRAIFIHGITLPLISSGAKIFALLALLLLFAWAALLKSMDVLFFHNLFQEPWFILPFIGAVGGLSIALMRAQQSVLGALRFILLLFSRIIMPIMAIFSLTFIFVLIANGPGEILAKGFTDDFFLGQASAIILFISFFAMLVFNGVYQNGEGGPPPAWLRIATIITIASFPLYAGLAAYGLWVRIGEYGLTPPRIFGFAISTLAFIYSFVCISGLITELNWRGKRWMPLVAKLNPLMAITWIAVLFSLATPIANTWAMSAKSQEKLLLSGNISVDDFDFGYLKFELGDYGDQALNRLAENTTHPDALAIRAGVERARAATSSWEYRKATEKSTEENDSAVTLPSGEEEPAPESMQLDLNPADNPDRADEDAATDSDPQ